MLRSTVRPRNRLSDSRLAARLMFQDSQARYNQKAPRTLKQWILRSIQTSTHTRWVTWYQTEQGVVMTAPFWVCSALVVSRLHSLHNRGRHALCHTKHSLLEMHRSNIVCPYLPNTSASNPLWAPLVPVWAPISPKTVLLSDPHLGPSSRRPPFSKRRDKTFVYLN